MALRDLMLTPARLAEMFRNPSGTQKKGRAPEGCGQGDVMLNILHNSAQLQHPLSFVTEGFVALSAVQANQVLLHAGYEGQRKIIKSHVDVLADIMRRNGWLPKNQIDFARIGGELILINGYHRMNAQVASGRSILWTIAIHDCKTKEDVRALYYKFDTNARIRGAAQVLNGINFAEQAGLSKTIAKALYDAVPIIAAGFSKAVRDRDVLTTRNTDRRLALAMEYAKAARLYQDCIGRLPVKVGSKFRSAGITAVALATLRYQPISATDFWKGVAENDGLRKGDPRLALHNDMLSRAMNVGSQIQSVFAPSYAWNAWFEGRDVKIIKVYARTRATILGTPFED